jgi:hypothetical protein
VVGVNKNICLSIAAVVVVVVRKKHVVMKQMVDGKKSGDGERAYSQLRDDAVVAHANVESPSQELVSGGPWLCPRPSP